MGSLSNIIGCMCLLGCALLVYSQDAPDITKYSNYFFRSEDNMHLPRSRVLTENVNETDCLRECLDSPSCFGVDYDTERQTCYDHSQATYCEELFPSMTRRHHRRIPCFDDKEFASSLYQYTRVAGGQLACSSCSLDMCFSMCAADTTCTALDYSFNARTCQHHHRDVLCSDQIRTGNADHLHAQKTPCKLEPSRSSENSLQRGMDVTDKPLMVPNFEVPFAGMVARMSGLRVRGGSLRISGVSETRCTRICRRADPTRCHAVDFDVERNECIMHTSETACDDLVRNGRFNHHRRFACAQTRIDFCAEDQCQNNAECRNGVMDYECLCQPGYSGINCEIDDDECRESPCQNGGSCVDGLSSFTCQCSPGYTGDTCQADINDCLPSPCENGGTCTDLLNGYQCDCVEGFNGRDCDNNIDDCAGSPCFNGGTCVDGLSSYQCQCLSDFNGTDCVNAINLCGLEPCQNGASCNNLIDNYTCDCVAGYEGYNCETNIDECADEPCLNGGRCSDGIDMFICMCSSGYDGLNCGQNIDECSSSPCQNGATCVDGINGHTCQCTNGYRGQNCQIDIDDCAGNPCRNGATCSDRVASFQCGCTPGFSGATCEINVNECSGQPCVNRGQCIDMVADFQCICAPGFTGKTCSINIDECASDPCVNGGSCRDDLNAYVCRCADGFTGANCETEHDECESNPCQNAATCVDMVAEFRCLCHAGYEGDLCETDINDCDPNPCDNNGRCFDFPNEFHCGCRPGYRGPRCEMDIDECAPNPCMNNAMCVDGSNNYTCQCQPGFTGRICEINLNECQINPCSNGGTCVDDINSFDCLCPAGFTGNLCQTDIDDCADTPCQNGGSCTDIVEGYTCDCSTAIGYDGDNCEIDINDCDPNPCRNGGACTDLVNDYVCSCPPAFLGKDCSGSELVAWPMTCLMGGIQMGPVRTASQCIAECMSDVECLAVDFDMRDGDCLIHKHGSACNTRQTCDGKIHYQMAPCLEEVSGTRINVVRSRRSGVSVQGGELLDCPFCSRDMCLVLCADREDCVGIDFYHVESEKTCVVHTAETACNAFVPNNITSHYSMQPREFCPDQPTDAITSGFVERNFPGPTVILPGWQAYPARHQLRGRPLGSAGMTGDQCVTMCDEDPNCFALDYNSVDGSCFSHWTLDRKCTPLLDSTDVYHLKKPGPCEEENYPEPALIGVA